MSEVTTNTQTTEEKKAAAAQARADAKAKRDAEKQAAKENREALKASEKAQREQEAVNQAGTIFQALNEAVTMGKALIERLNNGEVTVEPGGKLLSEAAVDMLGVAKGHMKDIKTLVRKNKGSETLEQCQTSAQDLLNGLADAIVGIKAKAAEAKAAQKAAEKEQKRLAREAERAANAMPKQNDVTRPRPGTACGDAWELFDQLSAKMGQPVPIAIALQASETKGLVYDTVKTQYARWKKFNGITGRVAMPVPAGLLD